MPQGKSAGAFRVASGRRPRELRCQNPECLAVLDIGSIPSSIDAGPVTENQSPLVDGAALPLPASARPTAPVFSAPAHLTSSYYSYSFFFFFVCARAPWRVVTPISSQ